MFKEKRDCDLRVLGFVNWNIYVNDGFVYVFYVEEDEVLEILF